jgi:hypothetical protein
MENMGSTPERERWYPFSSPLLSKHDFKLYALKPLYSNTVLSTLVFSFSSAEIHPLLSTPTIVNGVLAACEIDRPDFTTLLQRSRKMLLLK